MLWMLLRRLPGILLVVVCLSCSACSQDHGLSRSHIAERLRIGVIEEPDSLNPLFSHTAVADDVAALTLAPLFRYDPAGEFVPELASRVPTVANGDISADGRRVILRMRSGLHWADGAALDARDVRFTWQAVLNPRNATKLRSGWENILAIDLPNRRTAVLHLAKPDATLLTLFAGGGDAAYPPLPVHRLGRLPDLNQADVNAAPLSSGPWILERWERGSFLRFRANPFYWRGRPHLRRLELIVLPDAQTLVAALQSHEIDMLTNVPEDRLPDVRHIAGITLRTHTIAAFRHLDFNCRDAILQDARVRLALIEAVDWPHLLHTVYHDAGTAAVSDIFPASWAAPHLAPYHFSPELASLTLAKAGWRIGADGLRRKSGRILQLTIMSGSNKQTSARAEIAMQSYWQAIGVSVEPKNLSAAYLFAEDGPLYTGRYQMAWMSDTRAPDPDNLSMWSSSAMPPNGANTVYLHDALVDRYAQLARAVNTRLHRRQLYQNEEERLHALAPTYIFAWQRETMAFDQHLTGLQAATYFSDFMNSWQWSIKP